MGPLIYEIQVVCRTTVSTKCQCTQSQDEKNNSSTGVGACVLILVDLLSNIQIYV